MGWSSNSLQENVHSNAGVTIFFLSLHFSLGSCRGPLRKEGSVAYSPWPFVLSMSHRLANIGVGVGRGAICSPGEWESHTYKFRWPFLFLSHCFFMHGLRQVSTNCFSLQQPGPMQGPPPRYSGTSSIWLQTISLIYIVVSDEGAYRQPSYPHPNFKVLKSTWGFPLFHEYPH